MKKCLLVLCAAAGFCTLSAQKVSDFSANNAAVRNTVPFEAAEMVLMSAQNQAPYAAELSLLKAEGETHTGSALYRLPIGSYIDAMNPDWRSYTASIVYIPALTEVTLQNYCKIDSKRAAKENLGWTMLMSETETDLDSLMNEKGDLVDEYYGSYHAPSVNVFAPEDTEHSDEPLASYTYFRDEEEPESSYIYAGTDTIEYIGNATAKDGPYSGFSSGGRFTTNQNFLTLDVDEQGKVKWVDTGKKCVGFAEYYSAPIDMLYVTSVYMNLTDLDETSVEGNRLEGKTLTAKVMRVTEDGLETFATATATEENLLYDDSGRGTLTFNFVEDDPIFGEMDAPIVLDNTSDYLITITGFEQLTTDWTCMFSGADGFEGFGYAILEDGSLATVGYSNALDVPQVCLFISFQAALPVALVTESCKDVTVTIPAEGGYGVTVYDEEEQQWYNDFDIYTMNSSEWWEEIEAPGWVSIEYNDDYVERGLMAVFIKAGALPKNVTERHGDVIISLYGKEIVIPVAQGDVPGAVPVMSTDTEKKVYFNTLGQRELNPVQGRIYISDGQKEVF